MVDKNIIQGIIDESGSSLNVDEVSNVNDVVAIVAFLLEPATPDPADCKLAAALSDAINAGEALIDD